MLSKVNQPVEVVLICAGNSGRVRPYLFWWQQKKYLVDKVGLHHTYWQGKTLIHVFSVMANGLFFRLTLNSQTLCFMLEETSDGLAA